MRIHFDIQWLIIVVIAITTVTGFYLFEQYRDSANHVPNTAIMTTGVSQQNIPQLGACTGPLGKSKELLFRIQSDNYTNSVPATLWELDNLTITCNGPADIMKLPDNFTALGGQCCGALKDLTEYNRQLEGLKQFSDISDIPQNPYIIPVVYAKKMMAYDQKTVLTSDQQTTLEQATKLSKEGGPCCCKCWHWYFNEGIAKKLIVEHNFSAQQVANFYDLSGICGV